MNTYLRILAVFYLYGALVHLADLLSLSHHLGTTHSLALPEMSIPWQIGTVGSAAVDLVAAAGLWLRAWWGVMAFLAFAGFLTADGGLVVTALLGGRMLVCGRSADDGRCLYQTQADFRLLARGVVIPLAVLVHRCLLFRR